MFPFHKYPAKNMISYDFVSEKIAQKIWNLDKKLGKEEVLSESESRWLKKQKLFCSESACFAGFFTYFKPQTYEREKQKPLILFLRSYPNIDFSSIIDLTSQSVVINLLDKSELPNSKEGKEEGYLISIQVKPEITNPKLRYIYYKLTAYMIRMLSYNEKHHSNYYKLDKNVDTITNILNRNNKAMCHVGHLLYSNELYEKAFPNHAGFQYRELTLDMLKYLYEPTKMMEIVELLPDSPNFIFNRIWDKLYKEEPNG